MFLLLSIFCWGYILDFKFVHNMQISGDPVSLLWLFKWWPYALSNGINPFYSHALWAPVGQNMASLTAMPSVALLFWPTTVIFNPILSSNLAVILTLSVGTFGIYLICNDGLKIKRIYSILASLTFFCSTYQWGQLFGHATLYITFVLPLLIYVFILRFNGRIRTKGYLFFTSILLIFQFGISKEIYATFITFSFIAWAISYIIYFRDKAFKKVLKSIGIESIIAIGISLIVLLPYLIEMTHGTVRTNSVNIFSANLLSFVIPTPTTYLFSQSFVSITQKFSAGLCEGGAYLGLPIILIVLSFAKKQFRSSKLCKFLTILFCTLLISCLGPHLRILNHNTGIQLPWLIMTKLPLIKIALPVRFSLFLSIVAAIIVALWLEKGKINKYIKTSIAICAVIFLIPNFSIFKHVIGSFSYPSFISKKIYKRYIKPGSNVIVFSGSQGVSRAWQYKTNYYFNISQGLFGGSFFGGRHNNDLQKRMFGHVLNHELLWMLSGIYLISNKELSAQAKKDFCNYLIKCKVDAILINEKLIHIPITQKNINFLGIKPKKIGGVLIYYIEKDQIERILEIYKKKELEDVARTLNKIKQASLVYYAKFHSFKNLYPTTLESFGLMDKSFGGFPIKSSAKNWFKKIPYWVGMREASYAIGVVTNGDLASRLVKIYKKEAEKIYFPYPKVFNQQPSTKSSSGLLLIVFKKSR